MRRLNKILKKDGKSVIIAMDHGLAVDVASSLIDIEDKIEKVIKGGADAILTTFGIAKRYQSTFSETSLILRLDGGNTELTDKVDRHLLYSVEDALRLGADGVACMGFPGAENEEETLINLAEVASDCEKWNMPLIAEMLPGGFGQKVPNNIENIKFVSRVGAEMGADIIKTSYVGNKNKFKEVVNGTFSPIVILGGSKVESIFDLFKAIEDSINVGAKGVAIGRNVWKHESPQKMTKALVELVHNNKSAEEVLENI